MLSRLPAAGTGQGELYGGRRGEGAGGQRLRQDRARPSPSDAARSAPAPPQMPAVPLRGAPKTSPKPNFGLVYNARKSLQQQDPEAPGALSKARGWMRAEVLLASIPGAVRGSWGEKPQPHPCHGLGGDLAASPASGRKNGERGSRACRGSHENWERMRGSGRGGDRARGGWAAGGRHFSSPASWPLRCELL